MSIIRYTKWSGSILDRLNLEDLLEELSEFFLQSGYPNDPWGDPDTDVQKSLREEIVEKLVQLGHIPPEMRDNWLANPDSEEARELDEIVSQIIRRMIDEGWLRSEQREDSTEQDGEGYESEPTGRERFELTSKSADFLGFRQLRHLLG